jgi:hypothetical protein
LKCTPNMTRGDLKAMIQQELAGMYGDEIAMPFKRDAILFGASAPSDTIAFHTFTIHGNVQLIAQLPSFELNGASFKRVHPNSPWAPDHEFCIALMPSRPPSTGKAGLVWFDLAHD